MHRSNPLSMRHSVQIGGFDFRYERGYYEGATAAGMALPATCLLGRQHVPRSPYPDLPLGADTDLAMSFRAHGLDVVYQPLAVVFHQEGSTFGTDATSALKRELMAANRQKFLDKWQQPLEASARVEALPTGQAVSKPPERCLPRMLQGAHCTWSKNHVSSSRRLTSPAVLWVDDIVPEPDHDSGGWASVAVLASTWAVHQLRGRLACPPRLNPQHQHHEDAAERGLCAVVPAHRCARPQVQGSSAQHGRARHACCTAPHLGTERQDWVPL